MATIRIKNLLLRTFIGFNPEELVNKQDVIINIEIETVSFEKYYDLQTKWSVIKEQISTPRPILTPFAQRRKSIESTLLNSRRKTIKGINHELQASFSSPFKKNPPTKSGLLTIV